MLDEPRTNGLPTSNLVLAMIVAFAAFVVAIITRNFWLSLALGVVGAAAFVYAVRRLRQYRKNLPEDDIDIL